jgi:hypothetical protein
MVAGGVTAGTRKTYKQAPLLWDEYRAQDPTLLPGDVFLDRISPWSHAVVINRFLEWMITARERGTLNPASACRIITGLRFHFITAHRSSAPFDCEQVSKAKVDCRSGLRHTKWATSRSGLQTLPFTVGLLANLRSTHWAGQSADLDSKMIYIGVATGVCLGLRPGEAAYCGPYFGDPHYPEATALDHTYFLRDLLFEVTSEVDGVYSYDTYLTYPDLNRPPIDLITFTKDTSKTSRGEPDGLTHHVTRGNPTETQFFEDLLEWVHINGNDDGNHMLFSRNAYVSRDPNRRSHKKLTYYMYSTAIKGVAKSHDLPVELFSGKSPRVNAVTNSEMAGNSSLRTRQVTGHRSESAARHYLHVGLATAPTSIGTPFGAMPFPTPTMTSSTSTSFAVPCAISVASLKRVAARGQVVRDSKTPKI